MTETEVFKHSTPALYDRYMGPLLFEPYAKLVAERSALFQPSSILETAAGTGIVTRAVHQAVPQPQIVATDINPAMLEFAAQRVRSERVTFQRADAQDLPFVDGSFDLVLCQFGVMFFPDKVSASREAWRVLRSGGHYLFVTFDRLGLNPVPEAAENAVAALFPDDPPQYMERGPFSYSDPTLIKQDLVAAGFTDVELETVALTSHVGAHDAAQGIVLGSPLRTEIERRDATALDRAVNAVTEELRPWDGKEAPISAHVVTATK
ncbi:MAG: class I SAM-dependent methyltransferase [Pyrinomonadaceae bacterium]|nr:class I SAM-dependent methyltransferase [Pyrinomonadaceae bacterium]